MATPSSVATTVLKNVKKGISALSMYLCVCVCVCKKIEFVFLFCFLSAETIQGLAGKAQQVTLESADIAHRSTVSQWYHDVCCYQSLSLFLFDSHHLRTLLTLSLWWMCWGISLKK